MQGACGVLCKTDCRAANRCVLTGCQVRVCSPFNWQTLLLNCHVSSFPGLPAFRLKVVIHSVASVSYTALLAGGWDTHFESFFRPTIHQYLTYCSRRQLYTQKIESEDPKNTDQCNFPWLSSLTRRRRLKKGHQTEERAKGSQQQGRAKMATCILCFGPLLRAPSCNTA